MKTDTMIWFELECTEPDMNDWGDYNDHEQADTLEDGQQLLAKARQESPELEIRLVRHELRTEIIA